MPKEIKPFFFWGKGPATNVIEIENINRKERYRVEGDYRGWLEWTKLKQT